MMTKDFSYYIAQAREAENRSTALWRAINQLVRKVLETQRKQGKTLDETADILDEIAERTKKDGPVSINNIRTAARQIRARAELVLL